MLKVKLVKALTFELDPQKSYLIEIDKSMLGDDDIDLFLKELEKINIKNVTVIMLPEGKHLKITEEN
jgi:hypothetical protein